MTTRFAMVSEYSGKVSNKIEQGLRQKTAQPKTTGNSVMWIIKLKIANVVSSRMLHWPATCETQNQRHEVCCAYLDHIFSISSWMSKMQTAVSHSSAESETGLRMDGSLALQFLEYVLETLSSKSAKGNLERHQRERVILSHTHFDTCVFESLHHTFGPTFPAALIPTVQMIHKGRSPNFEARHANAPS